MCGFIGVVGQNSAQAIGHSLKHLKHRGPDDSQKYFDSMFSLGHARLSIIDHEGGRQPMHSPDGRWILAFNGEIFNYKILKSELMQDGEKFQTDHSDTEVLLKLLCRHGKNALPLINGMFSFALWDREKQILFCAKDRFGIKPLFYLFKENKFAVCSEIKPILKLPWVSTEANLDSIYHFLSLGYIPGENTSFSGVQRLSPGGWLTFSARDGILNSGNWYEPTFSEQENTRGVLLVEKLRKGLVEAVESWSIADVPIGCSLSGGLDSSAIVGILADKGVKLKTFSVGFSGRDEQKYDELNLARMVARRWKTDHQEVILDPGSLLSELTDMVSALEEPYGGGLPSWAVFKEMQGKVKVALTGVGGDELFGAYNRFLPMEGEIRSRIPGLARSQINRKQFEIKWISNYTFVSDLEKQKHWLTGRFKKNEKTGDLMWNYFNKRQADGNLRNRTARLDLDTQLPAEYLQMTDRFSMVHSIEARTPFLDHRLVESVFSVPASRRWTPFEYKGLLKEIVAPWVPGELLHAPKKGFVIPLKYWLRGPLKNLLVDLLSPARLKQQGLIQEDFFSRYAVPHLQEKADNTGKLWVMLMFQLWWNNFIEIPNKN